MDSLWTQSAKHPRFAPLNGSLRVDVLIIGGGMAGLLTAYRLKAAGIDCALVEAGQICGGVSGNTTAKITWQHGPIYTDLIHRFGIERARQYLDANRAACAEYCRLCREIDCDYEPKDSFAYSIDDRAGLEREIRALERLSAEVEFSESIALPFKVAGAVRVKAQAQFHPLKFAYAIAEGLPIYEDTKVLELMPHKAVTNHGEIECSTMIVATHFPMLNKHGGYFLKLYQDRSYVIAVDGAADVGGMYIDKDRKGLSFRNYKNLLLLGGGAHRTGKKGGGWDGLSEFVRTSYPTAKIVGRWATQDCMTLDDVPYIGRYGKRTEGLFVATGFNKWGMSSSMVSAMVLTDLVKGDENEFAAVFAPDRSILRPQLLVNAWESTIGLLTPTVPRCPHLGCALKYNAAEHSWDCPCHGSRFTEEGRLINNPATDDKKM